MRKSVNVLLLSFFVLFLLLACAAPQVQKPTIEKLAEDLLKAINSSLVGSYTAIDNYVKTLSSETSVLTAKSSYINNLRDTLISLGTNAQLLSLYEYSTKSSIYSFDLSLKPDVVDKIYIMNLLLVDQSQMKRSVYTLPFITLKSEPDKIYLAVIFVRDTSVVVYPKPIQ